MKKILSLLGAITVSGAVVPNVVACLPPRSSGGNIIGEKLDLGLFSFAKIEKKFSLKKENVIVNNKIDLAAGITKGIQNLTSVSLPWREVNVNVATPANKETFQQVYMKIEAKDDAKSVKGSVAWGDSATKPPSYVDLRPVLDNWLSTKKLEAKSADELDTKATEALGGIAFKQNNLVGLGLKGTYDSDQKLFRVSVIDQGSDFFRVSEIVFNVDIK